MNNKGFIFIETIITVVILMTTLVFLYSSYSSVVITEQRRLYHDDIAYVYKTQHIRDVLDLTLDYSKFNNAIDYKMNLAPVNERMYIYVFNIESDIYKDNSLISAAQDLYKFYRLVYLKISDIETLKNCIKTGERTPDQKCKTTLRFANAHGFSYLQDYILTLDVPNTGGKYKNHEGILISLIYEAKNGDVAVDSNNVIQVGKGKYSECILEKVRNHYTTGTDEDKMRQYNADDKINFNMACENAYYLSWVYL
ncbi:MAG: hypothetical protein E7164_03000 [Firmicutes bacterium]|nr:hypothetical protein [Bacillota bacterium]